MLARNHTVFWCALLLPMLLLCAVAAPAGAHFLINLNVRILHVEHLADGLRVYMRMPMPYLVADRVGPARAGGLPEPLPYTTNAMERWQEVTAAACNWVVVDLLRPIHVNVTAP